MIPPSPYNALVIGASGGIGGALLNACAADPLCARTIGLSRHSTPALDLTDEASIAHAVDNLKPLAPFHRIMIATGALSLNGMGPEKKLADLQADQLIAAFTINSIGPALILKHITALVPRDQQCVIGILSARVGSISDNRAGGWYSYRASKAALNMLIRTSAIELARKYPKLILTALHPGTVATQLSQPYVSQHTPFSPPEAAEHILSVIARLTAQDHGGFIAWDGKKIDW
jgi:NAD(P)-dependent dehydrogenase (short-subunit alcohol dehydrogenase family)